MKRKSLTAGIVAGLIALWAAPSYGSFGHDTQSTNGNTASWTGTVDVPSTGYVQQFGQVYNSETTWVNNGPLGSYNGTNVWSLNITGQCAAGSYSIYQAVVRGGGYQPAQGVSATSISW